MLCVPARSHIHSALPNVCMQVMLGRVLETGELVALKRIYVRSPGVSARLLCNFCTYEYGTARVHLLRHMRSPCVSVRSSHVLMSLRHFNGLQALHNPELKCCGAV